MAWITPKTDWAAKYDSAGNYIGDWFNVADYNRIKNNIVHLREIAIGLVGTIPEINVGPDKHEIDPLNPDWENDSFFASEINAIEDALDTIAVALPFIDFGTKKTYYDNGVFIDYLELNRLESLTLEAYETVTNAIAHKPRFAYRLGSGKFQI